MDNEFSADKLGKCRRFDFCFWGKLLVAIPVFPIVIFGAASLFHDLLLQSVAAAAAAYGLVWAGVRLNRKLERHPVLSRKILKAKD